VEGLHDGDFDGVNVGDVDGDLDGLDVNGEAEGVRDGALDGVLEGRDVVGARDGVLDGDLEGVSEGVDDGDLDGREVVGAMDGDFDGRDVEGDTDGVLDGREVEGPTLGLDVTGDKVGDDVGLWDVGAVVPQVWLTNLLNTRKSGAEPWITASLKRGVDDMLGEGHIAEGERKKSLTVYGSDATVWTNGTTFALHVAGTLSTVIVVDRMIRHPVPAAETKFHADSARVAVQEMANPGMATSESCNSLKAMDAGVTGSGKVISFVVPGLSNPDKGSAEPVMFTSFTNTPTRMRLTVN
jgi:hypothetical protein